VLGVWGRHLRETVGRGSPVAATATRWRVSSVVGYWPTMEPPGYGEATGEELATNSDEAAV
jgi:hypothetical protein